MLRMLALSSRGLTNALRHQMNNHMGNKRTNQRICSCAQRLTASKELSLLRQGGRPGLTASKELSLRASDADLIVVPQCSTPYGIKGIITHVHQPNVRPLLECSTPYGIKGIITQAYPSIVADITECSTPYGIKGIITVFEAVVERPCVMCSTPYGIKGIITSPSAIETLTVVCAQRLTASKELSHKWNSSKKTCP